MLNCSTVFEAHLHGNYFPSISLFYWPAFLSVVARRTPESASKRPFVIVWNISVWTTYMRNFYHYYVSFYSFWRPTLLISSENQFQIVLQTLNYIFGPWTVVPTSLLQHPWSIPMCQMNQPAPVLQETRLLLETTVLRHDIHELLQHGFGLLSSPCLSNVWMNWLNLTMLNISACIIMSKQ